MQKRDTKISTGSVRVAFVMVTLWGATVSGQADSGQIFNQSQSSFGVAGMEGVQSAGTNALSPAGQAAPVNVCPVSMRAQYLSDGNLIDARESHPTGVGQRLHLSLASRDSRQVTRATLKIRGFSPKARVTQTGPGGDQSFDATQTLTAVFAVRADRNASAEFRVPGMSAVGRIEIEALEYSDGTTWKMSGASSCRVAPDPEMPITSH